MATFRRVTGWSASSAFNNNNSYNNRNNTAGQVRTSPQNCHIPSVITRERLWHHKIVTLNRSSTNEAVLLKFSRSKGYSKHQSDCKFRAVLLTWKLHLHAIFSHSKIAKFVSSVYSVWYLARISLFSGGYSKLACTAFCYCYNTLVLHKKVTK